LIVWLVPVFSALACSLESVLHEDQCELNMVLAAKKQQQ
jgi:hypothetical protein